jgi:carbonic anhydrase
MASPARPRRELAVVTCMDVRIDPAALLGLEAGDAHVIRNAGGLVTPDVIRSLALSQAALGTRDVILILHTDCGVGSASESTLRDGIAKSSGAMPDFEIGAFGDVEEAVREGCRTIRSSPVLSRTRTLTGFVYDVHEGTLSPVDGC